MKNTWHIQAENALNKTYQGDDSPRVPFEIEDEFYHYIECKLSGLFYEMNPEEQCLFLLFCGESYEG